jgi:hypothetical protein
MAFLLMSLILLFYVSMWLYDSLVLLESCFQLYFQYRSNMTIQVQLGKKETKGTYVFLPAAFRTAHPPAAIRTTFWDIGFWNGVRVVVIVAYSPYLYTRLKNVVAEGSG